MTDNQSDEDIGADGDWFTDEHATFGDRVVAARQAMGWAQNDLARQLGVKLKTVQSWEDDLSEPRANKAHMLAGVLNISLAWLLTGEGLGITDPDQPSVPAQVKEVLAQMRQLRAQIAGRLDQLAVLEKRLSDLLTEGL
ncbi:MAG: transcriptional regulator [Rhodobacterales bacterium]|nr:MAG: transcriptional regulator [Rhodobacterales bacterium]